jgi:hypothetical protein
VNQLVQYEDAGSRAMTPVMAAVRGKDVELVRLLMRVKRDGIVEKDPIDWDAQVWSMAADDASQVTWCGKEYI